MADELGGLLARVPEKRQDVRVVLKLADIADALALVRSRNVKDGYRLGRRANIEARDIALGERRAAEQHDTGQAEDWDDP